MSVIDEFITRYHREIDFYTEVARLASQQLDLALTTRGIRAIVTFRSKRPDRLKAKLTQRSRTHRYATLEDISQDIADLAGVRVALYFPGDREKVARLVLALFEQRAEPKEFPEQSKVRDGKRFSGYWATHYRVGLKESSLLDAQKRFSAATVEIQVASVLMHAWAEVEHDLVYKPLQGTVSADEHAILDELNGLVLAGEIALERLQTGVETRLANVDARFRDQFDLGSYLFERARELVKRNNANVNVGRVDLLMDLLRELQIDTPKELQNYFAEIDPDLETTPLADQILDRILARDPSRYRRFSELRSEHLSLFGSFESRDYQQKAIGYFLNQWIKLERAVRANIPFKRKRGRAYLPILESLKSIRLDKQTQFEFERLRGIRNNLVHGIEIPEPDYLMAAGDQIDKLVYLVKTHRKRKS